MQCNDTIVCNVDRNIVTFTSSYVQNVYKAKELSVSMVLLETSVRWNHLPFSSQGHVLSSRFLQ